MRKDRLEDLLCQMIDCVDTLNGQDNLDWQTSYDIIKQNTDIEDGELAELDIDIETLQKEVE